MALQGSLKIGGRSYGIVECNYEFSQSVDDTGKPTSRPRGGTITFLTPTPSDEDQFFYRWMFSKFQIYSGTFTFVVYSQGGQIKHRTVTFNNAYCIHLRDTFSDYDSRLMYTQVTLSAQSIEIGSGDVATFTNDWSSTR